jgi:CheY-like chemotaxis protein
MNTSVLNILVVESEIAVAAPLIKALELNGHRATHVTTARSAVEAVEAGQASEHDAVVAATELPDGCGLDVCDLMRQRGSKARFVFMADNPTIEDYRCAMRVGATDLFTKPLDPSVLVGCVENSTSSALAIDVPVEEYERSYRAVSPCVEEAARDLAGYLLRCGIGPSCRTRVASACAEAIDNIVEHAYPGSCGSVHVVLTVGERELRLAISDTGVGFDSTGACLTHMASDSRSGLARIAALAEDVQVASEIGVGSCIRMRFSALRVFFDEGEHVDLSELDFLTPRTARRVIESLNDSETSDLFHLSPALAVTVGRLLAGPTPRRSLQSALWS